MKLLSKIYFPQKFHNLISDSRGLSYILLYLLYLSYILSLSPNKQLLKSNDRRISFNC